MNEEILEHIFKVLDWVLFAVFMLNVVYLLFYSLASRRQVRKMPEVSDRFRRFAIFIPAYKEDGVIEECVHACLEQDYPMEHYDVVVISDRMESATNDRLRQLPIRLLEVHFEHSTKAKSLNAAIASLDDSYDIAVVLDADNVVPYNYLSDVNAAFEMPSVEVIQTHRIAKNLNNDMALLDAISEEINNSIFRLGHVNVGMSAALIGSGMAFDYALFKETMSKIKAVGGFDREMELLLLYQRKRFYYMPETFVFDEKIQTSSDFSRQRRRWLSAQIHYCQVFGKYFWKAFYSSNWDFCDKMLQQVLIPRLLLLGFVPACSLLVSLYSWQWGIKWCLLFVLLAMALFVAIPKRFYTSRLVTAFQKLPSTFWLMFLSVFKLKGANKTFIHTRHGVVDSNR